MENSVSNVPAGLKYSNEHEWVRAETDGTLSVGMTDFAVKQLGEIMTVELPQVGGEVYASDGVGTVESVKAVTEIYAPVTGSIVEVNPDVSDDPEKLNSDPYGTWLFKVRLAKGESADNLLDAAAYTRLIEQAD
jgi:glycine cleavage system H protein